MAPATLLKSVRVLDPQHSVDRVADVLIAHGRVLRIGDPGSSQGWPEMQDETESVDIIDGNDSADELLLVPGLVDIHSHIFGAAGASRVDRVGVEVGVPTVVDAGGAGAATIDDFLALRGAPARTRVRSLMSIEAGGITEAHPAHNTSRSASQMVTTSIDAFMGALEKHKGDVVGLKIWASAASGLPWLDYGVNLSEMTSLPIMVHIGEEAPTNGQSLTGEVIDRLQGGDIITHCYTGLPGGLVDASGAISNEVIVGRDRGVLFDPAPGLFNLCFDRATAAMEQGWLPDTISSDAHRWVIEQNRSAGLPQVMSMFLALGLSLSRIIECASTRAADALGIPTGNVLVGSQATLSLLRLRRGPAIFSDGTQTIRGDETLVPEGCFIDGEWIEANADNRVATPEVEFTADIDRFLGALTTQLFHHQRYDERWRGPELHVLVHRARRECRLSIPEALRALYLLLGSEDSTIAAGWILEELGPVDSLELLQSRRLAGVYLD